jgi:hypothetical protein
MDDFWWLTPTERQEYIYVELVHHRPLREEDNSAHSSFSSPCFARIVDIEQWRNNNHNTNVYRSLQVWRDASKTKELSGPLILDIDNDDNDLGDALVVTREVVDVVRSYHIKESAMRVFFTGHKGFNIELCSKALRISGTVGNQTECVRKEIIKKLQEGKNLGGGFTASFENGAMIFRERAYRRRLSTGELSQKTANLVSRKGTVIDRTHDYVRLHGSINEWVESGKIKARMKTKLTVEELRSLTIGQTISRSEESTLHTKTT